MSTIISIEDVYAKALRIANQIVREHSTNSMIKVYGVPRGGIVAAAAVVKYSDRLLITGNADQADVFVDDLIDSGATREFFASLYPDKKFYALYEHPTEWLVFPWEVTEEGSADDIPKRLLQFMGEDETRGGLEETPARYLKAWKHFTSGYTKDPAEVMKVFKDGAESYDEMVLVKSIPVYSQCEHHLVPFFGVAHVAYIPNGKIVGLSKLSRVVDIFARRLQVQERLTDQIAQAIQENLLPLGVGVVLECRHLCMEARGICQQGHTTVTSSMRGVFKEHPETRAEFMGLIRETK